ncbi:MAG: hypothetical protein DRP97_04730, partial [Candidatus Latescibacterota bacterium]
MCKKTSIILFGLMLIAVAGNAQEDWSAQLLGWGLFNESGFENTKNGMVTSMAVLDGQLCAGTDKKTNNCDVTYATASVTSNMKSGTLHKDGQIDWDGHQRLYYYYEPSDPGTSPQPLVIIL